MMNIFQANVYLILILIIEACVKTKGKAMIDDLQRRQRLSLLNDDVVSSGRCSLWDIYGIDYFDDLRYLFSTNKSCTSRESGYLKRWLTEGPLSLLHDHASNACAV